MGSKELLIYKLTQEKTLRSIIQKRNLGIQDSNNPKVLVFVKCQNESINQISKSQEQDLKALKSYKIKILEYFLKLILEVINKVLMFVHIIGIAPLKSIHVFDLQALLNQGTFHII